MNTLMIREINTDKVVASFIRREILTQNEIAAETLLSLPSVGKILKGLQDLSLIVEIESGESSGGRKPKRYTLSENKWLVGVIYIEKNESILNIMTPFFKSKFRITVKIEIYDNHSLDSVISQLLEKARNNFPFFKEVTSWGVVVPGIVDLEKNFIIYSKPLGVSNYQIERAINKTSNELDIYLFRDTDAYLLSNISETVNERIAFVYVNDGVGLSMIKDNQLLKNVVGSLEIGHTIYSDSQRGLKKIGEVFNKKEITSLVGIKSDAIHDFSMGKLKLKAENDTNSLEVLNDQIQALIVLIVNVMNLFNPSVVIVSGKYINDYNLDDVFEELEKNVLAPFVKNSQLLHRGSAISEAFVGVVRYINKKIVE